MIIRVLTLLLSLDFIGFSLSYASSDLHSYDRALDLDDNTILRVSSFLRKVQNRDPFSEKVSIVSSESLDVKKNEGSIIIAVKEGTDSKGSESLLINFSDQGVEGRVFKSTKEDADIAFEAIGKMFTATDKLFQHDFIFTGKGSMGGVALLSALKLKLFLMDYVKFQKNSPSKYSLGQNRVKVILFNAPQVSDDKFIESMHKYIGIENILHFSHYSLKDIFWTSTRYKNIGLCLDILPFENLIDNKSKYLTGALSSIFLGIIGGWSLSEFGYDRLKGIPMLMGGICLFRQIMQGGNIPSDEVLKVVMSYVRSRKIEIGELWPVEKVGESAFLTYNRGISLLIQKVLEQGQLRSSL
jgi:hypothetical protein